MSSILSQYTLTEDQNHAVTRRGCDIAVTAGAGSGKTRTLVGRYLSLLEEGLSPRQVAAITFTEKAAREMRTRIREMIQEWLQADLDEDGRHFWQSVYAEMDAAPIGTIHALCARLLRTHPVEAALDPAFDVLDESTAAALQAQAVETAMVWAANDPAAAALFFLLSEEGLRRTLAQLLQNRLDTAAAFAVVTQEPLTHWRLAALAALGGFLDDVGVATAVADLRALQTDGLLERLSGDKLAQTIADFLAAWEQIERARPANDLAALLTHLPAARRAMKPNLGRKSDWGDIDAPRQALTLLRRQYDASLSRLLAKPLDWTLDESAAEALPHLRAGFARALDAYEAAKAQRRALDFDDLEARAADLLENHAGVCAFWQEQIQAVLVDEFQDTNDRQRRIVYALTGFDQATRRLRNHATNLFVVGDAKQSIYRFRKADVTVFRRVQQNVADSGGEVINLDLTFRAHEPLVAQLNGLLGPIMDEVVDGKRPFAVPFAPLRAYFAAPRKPVQEPFVEFCLGVGENSSEGRTAAAQALARRLGQIHDAEQIGWGEMGLLCRASTSFPFYEDALEAAGIPFVTVAGRGFYDRPEVRDLLNALRAIANPRDDRALAGLLRSPALALTDAAIYLLRRGRAERERSLWGALRDDLALLAAADAGRARRAAEIVARLNNLVGRVSVARLLKQFLDLTHYAAILQACSAGVGASGGRTHGERARRNVEKLLADAHASRLVSVGEFLAYVQTLRDVAAREGEAPVEAGEAVQLMTVHKAKGLEFPLVIIADAGRRGGGRPGALLLDEQLGPAIKLSNEEDGRSLIYQLAAQRDQEQDDAEARRLLYVAATRAKQKLLISGQVDLSRAKRQPGKLLPKGWLGQLGAVVGLERQRVAVPLLEPCELTLAELDGRAVGCTVSPLRPLAPPEIAAAGAPLATEAEAVWPLPLLRPATAAPAVEEDERVTAREVDPPPRVWRVVPTAERPRGPAWVVGALFHEALRRWHFPGDAGFDDLMRRHAQEMGLTDEAEIGATIGRVSRLLQRFQEDALFQQIASARRRYHETPYVIEREGRVRSRVIDLLFERDGRWTVVDFKTNRLRDENALRSDKIEGYREQVRVYVTAVNEMLGVAAAGQLCFLDVGGRVWIEPVEAA